MSVYTMGTVTPWGTSQTQSVPPPPNPNALLPGGWAPVAVAVGDDFADLVDTYKAANLPPSLSVAEWVLRTARETDTALPVTSEYRFHLGRAAPYAVSELARGHCVLNDYPSLGIPATQFQAPCCQPNPYNAARYTPVPIPKLSDAELKAVIAS